MEAVPSDQCNSRRSRKAAGLSFQEKAIQLRDLQQALRTVHNTLHDQSAIKDIAGSMRSIHHALAPLSDSLPPLRNLVRDILKGLKTPAPLERHPVKRKLLDFAYPDVKLCIRLGGDLRSDRPLIREGWRVIRYSEEVIRKAPQEFGALVETQYGLLMGSIATLARKSGA